MNNTDLNSSIFVNSSSNPERFAYYSLFIVLLVLLPLAVVDIVVLVVIAREKTIPGFIRLILANNIASSEIVIAGLVQIFLANVILSVVGDKSPNAHYACRLALVTISSGGVGRFLFMSAFAVAVYCLVKSRSVHIDRFNRPTVIASIVLWICAVLPNTVLFGQKLVNIVFLDEITCTFYGVPPLSYIYSFGCIVIYGLCNLALGIIIPCMTVCYIKIHTLSGATDTIYGMIKCAVFLCVGNFISFIGLSIPLLISSFMSPERSYSVALASVKIQGILVILSLIPVPIFIIVYFKNIRKKFIFCLCVVKSHFDICQTEFNVV